SPRPACCIVLPPRRRAPALDSSGALVDCAASARQERAMRRRIVAGNWKLHGDRAFAHALMDAIAAAPAPAGVERIVLPPLPYLGELVEHYAKAGIAFGAQDVSANERGAYTGEVSASMLADVGARYGLVGHS